jgi:hypothetical protein
LINRYLAVSIDLSKTNRVCTRYGVLGRVTESSVPQGLASISNFMRHAQFRLKAWVCVCLLVTLFNAMVVQTHVHRAVGTHWVTAIKADCADAAGCHTSSHKAPTNTCPWCEELAQAGTYLPPAPMALIQLPDQVGANIPHLPTGIRPAISHYHWRSRAPPV